MIAQLVKANYVYLKNGLNHSQGLSLLFIRLVLAYGFFTPAMMKLTNVSGIIEWFAEMKLPFPVLNAYLATGTEVLGVILLTLGLATRFISIPLIVTMVVAIVTVHWENGFEAGNNGFEIPLYYMLMLFVLLTHGAGKWSIDYWLNRKRNE
jgi:putative oxidoreductase